MSTTNQTLEARADRLCEEHFRRTGKPLDKSAAIERILAGNHVEERDELGVKADQIQAEQRRRGVFVSRSEALERAIAESGNAAASAVVTGRASLRARGLEQRAQPT
jgi:hypothetical protein